MKLLVKISGSSVDHNGYCVHRSTSPKIVNSALNKFFVDKNFKFNADNQGFEDLCNTQITIDNHKNFGVPIGSAGKTLLEAIGNIKMLAQSYGYTQKSGVWGKEENPIGYISSCEIDRHNNFLYIKSSMIANYLNYESGVISNFDAKEPSGQLIHWKFIDFEKIESKKQESTEEFWQQYENYVQFIKLPPISKERNKYLQNRYGHIVDDPVFCNDEIQKEFKEYFMHKQRRVLPEIMRTSFARYQIPSGNLHLSKEEFEQEHTWKFGLFYDAVVYQGELIIYQLLSESQKLQWRKDFVKEYMSNKDCFYSSVSINPSVKLINKLIAESTPKIDESAKGDSEDTSKKEINEKEHISC